MREIKYLHSFLISLSLFFAFTASAQVKIGLVTDLSGPASYYGQQAQIAAKLVENEINVDGKKNLEILIEDNSFDIKKAISATEKLIYLDKVDSLHVHFTPIVTAVSPLIKNRKILLLYAAAAESVVHENPYAFKTYSNYRRGCEELAKAFKKMGIKKLGFLQAVAEYADLCSEGIKKVYQDFHVETYQRNEPVNTQMLKMKEADVEAIINAAYAPDIVNQIKAGQSYEFFPKIGTAQDVVDEKVRAEFSKQLQGSIVFGLQDIPNELLEKAKKIDGFKNLNSYEGVVLSYLHLKQLYKTALACSKNDIECQIKTLEKSSAEPILGFEKWENRIAVLKTNIHIVRDGKFEMLESYENND